MDPTSLLSNARARALAKKQKYAVKIDEHVTSDLKQVVRASGNFEPNSSELDTSKTNVNATMKNLVEENDAASLSDVATDSNNPARQEAAALLQRAKSRVATTTPTATRRAELPLGAIEAPNADKQHPIAYGQGVRRDKSGAAFIPNPTLPPVSTLKISAPYAPHAHAKVVKASTNRVATSQCGGKVDLPPFESCPSIHAEVLWDLCARLPSPPPVLDSDASSATLLFKDTFALSRAESGDVAAALQALETALQLPCGITAERVGPALHKLLLLLPADSSGADGIKLPLAIGAGGGCQLMAKLLTCICQQQNSEGGRDSTTNNNSSMQSLLLLCLTGVLRLVRVGSRCVLENFSILHKSRILDHFGMIYQQHAATSREVAAALLAVLEVAAVVEPLALLHTPPLLEVLMQSTDHHSCSDSQPDSYLFCTAFRIIAIIASSVEANASVLVEMGLLGAVSRALAHATSAEQLTGTPTSSCEALAASACEALDRVLQHKRLLHSAVAATSSSLCQQLAATFLAFRNNIGATSSGLVESSLGCIARLVGYSPALGVEVLQLPTTSLLGEVWKSLLQHQHQHSQRGGAEALRSVLCLAVLLTELVGAQLARETRESAPECVFGALAGMLRDKSSPPELRVLACFLLVNLLRTGDESDLVVVEKYNLCEEIGSTLQVVLAEESTFSDAVKARSLGAVSYLGRSCTAHPRRLRSTGLNTTLSALLAQSWQATDRQQHMLVLAALCALYGGHGAIPVEQEEAEGEGKGRDEGDVTGAVGQGESERRLVLSSSTLAHLVHLLSEGESEVDGNMAPPPPLAAVGLDLFSPHTAAALHAGTLAAELFQNFSHFSDCGAVVDEKICMELFDVVKRRSKTCPAMCASLLIFFRGMLCGRGGRASVQFLGTGAAKVLFDILCGRALDEEVCEAACRLLGAVLQTCRAQHRPLTAPLEYNSFFLQNIVTHRADSQTVSADYLLGAVRVLNELSFADCTLSAAEQARLQTFLLGTLRTTQGGSSAVVRAVLGASALIEVALSSPSLEICDEICQFSSHVMKQFFGREEDCDLCARVMDFMYLLSTFRGGYCLLKAYAKSDGVSNLMHCLSADGRSPDVLFQRSGLRWLNAVCRECPEAGQRVVDLNGCLVVLSLLDLACLAQDGVLAVEVSFAVKLLLKTHASKSRASFRELNALQFLVQGLDTAWSHHDLVISENLFWSIHLICEDISSEEEGAPLPAWDLNCRDPRDNEDEEDAGDAGCLSLPLIAKSVALKLKRQGMVSAALATAGCMAVTSLCSRGAAQLALGEQGCCAAVLALLGLFRADAPLVSSAAQALGALTGRPGFNIDLVRSKDFYVLLGELLQNASSEEVCAGLLNVILNCEEDYKLDIFRAIIMPKIYDCVKLYSESVSFFTIACQCIYLLADRFADNVKSVALEDVVQVIVSGMKAFVNDAGACRFACLALGSVAASDPAALAHQLIGAERVIVSVVHTHPTHIMVGKCACMAACCLAGIEGIDFSDAQFHIDVTRLMNAAQFESEEFDLFRRVLRITSRLQVSEEESVAAIDALACLRQASGSRDNNAYLSALLAVQSMAEQGLGCRLALVQSEALEGLVEAVSVWRAQPLLVATTLKAVRSLCWLEKSSSSSSSWTNSEGVVHLLGLDVPELVLAVVKERWESPDVVLQGTALLLACLRLNPARLSAAQAADLGAALVSVLSRHVHLAEVVETACLLMDVISSQCVEIFTEETSLVPLVDALRVHLSKAAPGNSSSSAALQACRTIAKLLVLGEPLVAAALGGTEFLMQVISALGSKKLATGEKDLFGLDALTGVRLLLDPAGGGGALTTAREVVQLGGCAVLVDMLGQQRRRGVSGGADCATLVCDIIYHVIRCEERAGAELSRVHAVSVIVKTARVFLDHAALCAQACRCLRVLVSTTSTSDSDGSAAVREDELCCLAAEVLRRHSQHSAAARESAAALVTWAGGGGDVHASLDPRAYDILGGALVGGLGSPEVVVQVCSLLTAVWPRLCHDSRFINQSISLFDAALAALRLYGAIPDLLGRVIDLVGAIVGANNAGGSLLDPSSTDSLCQRLEEVCESSESEDLGLLLPEVASAACSLLAEMCLRSPLCLRRIADSSICELVTVAYDQAGVSDAPAAALFRRKCVAVWAELVDLKVSFFCETHISYRLTSFLASHVASEGAAETVLRVLLTLLSSPEGAQEFSNPVEGEGASSSLLASLLSPLLPPRATAAAVPVLAALLLANARNTSFLPTVDSPQLCEFALRAASNSALNRGVGLCAAVRLATALLSSCPVSSGSFDFSQFCLHVATAGPLIREEKDVVALHDALAAFVSVNVEACAALLQRGGGALASHLAVTSAVGEATSVQGLVSAWRLLSSLVARGSERDTALVCSAVILDNAVANLEHFSHKTHEVDVQKAGDVVRMSCDVLAVAVSQRQEPSVSGTAGLLDTVLSSRAGAAVLGVCLTYLTNPDVCVSAVSAVTALCAALPDEMVPLFLRGGACSLLMTALEVHQDRKAVVVSLQKCTTSLIRQHHKEHQVSCFFSDPRFVKSNVHLLQVYQSDAATLLELCRACSAVCRAGMDLPLDVPAVVDCIANSLDTFIDEPFLVLELLVLMRACVSSRPSSRWMWRSQRHADVLTALLIVTSKYAQVDAVLSHALALIEELSLYDMATASEEGNAFSRDCFLSLLSLLRKSREGKIKASSSSPSAVITCLAHVVLNVCSAFSESVSVFRECGGLEAFGQELLLNSEQRNRDVVFALLSAVVVCAEADAAGLACVDKQSIGAVLSAFETDGLILSLTIRLQACLQGRAYVKPASAPAGATSSTVTPTLVPDSGPGPVPSTEQPRSQSFVTEALELLALLGPNIQDGKVMVGLCLGLCEYIRQDAAVADLARDKGCVALLCQALQLHAQEETVLPPLLDAIALLLSLSGAEELATGASELDLLSVVLRAVLEGGDAKHTQEATPLREKYLHVVALLSPLQRCREVLRKSGIHQHALGLLLAHHKSLTAGHCAAACLIVFHLDCGSSVRDEDDDDMSDIATPQLASALLFLIDKHGRVDASCCSALLALLSVLSSSPEGVTSLLVAKAADHVLAPLGAHFEQELAARCALKLLRDLAAAGDRSSLKSMASELGCSICVKILLHAQAYSFATRELEVATLEDLFTVMLTIVRGSAVLLRVLSAHASVIVSTTLSCVDDSAGVTSAGLRLLMEVYSDSAALPDNTAMNQLLGAALRRHCLTRDGVAVCDEVCRMVSLLSRTSSQTQSLLGEADLCGMLVEHMSRALPATSLLLVCDAAASLSAGHKENIAAMHASGAAGVLVVILRAHLSRSDSSSLDPSVAAVCRSIIRVMGTLINNDSENSLLYGSTDVCNLLSEVFVKGLSQPDIVRAIVEIVSTISRDNAENSDNVAATSMLRCLAQTLVVHAGDKDLVRAALRAVWCVCRSASPSARSTVKDLHLSQAIQTVMTRLSESVAGPPREGLGALLHASLLEYNSAPPQSMLPFFITAISKISDAELTQHGLEAIARLCGDEDCCANLLALGVADKVRSVLITTQESAQSMLVCCRVICALCRTEDGVVALLKIGIVEILCSTLMVFGSDRAAVCIATLQCFDSMLQHGYEEVAEDLVERQIHTEALRLLEAPLRHSAKDAASVADTSLIEHVFKFVRTIIVLVPSSALQFGLNGAVEVVLLVMQSQLAAARVSPRLCLEALALLTQLCTERQNVTKVVLSGGFQCMISLARKVQQADPASAHGRAVVCSLAGVISGMCAASGTHCTQYQNSLGACGACGFLVSMLEHWAKHAPTLADLAQALSALCSNNEANIRTVMSTSLTASLPSMFTSLCSNASGSGPHVAGALGAVCGLVEMLASSCPENADVLGMAGVCDNIVEALQASVQQQLSLPLLRCATALMKDNTGNQTAFGRNKNFYLQLKQLLKLLSVSSHSSEAAACGLDFTLVLLSAVAWSMALLGRSGCDAGSVNTDNCKAMFKHDLHPLLVAAVLKHNSYAAVAEAGCFALAHAAGGLSSQQVGSIGAAGGCDVVVNSLRNHSDKLSTLEAAMSALVTLSTSQDNVLLLKTLGVVDVLADMHLFSLSENISRLIPAALANISLDADISDAFGQLHICSDMASMFAQLDCGPESEVGRDLLLEMTTCVSSLLLSCPHNSVHFLDLIPQLIELLRAAKEARPCDETMVVAACTVLTSLLRGDDLSQLTLSSSQLCECLAETFSQRGAPPGVTLAVTNVIIALCLKHDFSARFVDLHVLSLANAMLHDLDEHQHQHQHAPALVASLQQLLRVLSCDSSARADLGLRGESSTIASLLRTHIASEHTTLKNCDALKKLIYKNTEHINILIEFGICDTLVEIMKKYPKHAEVLVECLLVQLFMLKNSDRVAGGLEVSGGLEVIVGCLRRHTGQVHDAASASTSTSTAARVVGLALRAVYELAAASSCRDKFQAAGAPEVVSEVFRGAVTRWDEGLLMWCCSATYRLCTGSPANQEAFGVAGVCLCVSSVLSKFAELQSETVEAVLLAVIFLSSTSTAGHARSTPSENIQNCTAFFNLQCDRNVVRILTEMLAVPDLMRVACSAVFVLARDAEAVHRLVALGAAEALSEVLVRYSALGPTSLDVSWTALMVLEPLLGHEDVLERCASRAVLSHCLDLLELQRGQFGEGHAEKICSIICQFARWQEVYVAKMMDRSVCDLLMRAFSSQAELRAGPAASFSNTIVALSTSHDIILKFLNLKAPRLLLGVLKAGGGEEVAVTSACAALGVLSTHTEFGAQFISNGDDGEEEEEVNRYALLVGAMRSFIRVKPIVESIFNVLINIYKHHASMNDAHTAQLVQANACALMPEILRKHSESATVVSKCCMVLSMLCLDDRAADVLVSCGACEAVTKALDLFSNDVAVAQYGCKFLRNLASLPDHRDLLLNSPSTVQILLRVFDRHHKTKKVLLEACAALVNLLGEKKKPDIRTGAGHSRLHNHTDVKQYFAVIAKAVALHVDSAAIVVQTCSLLRVLAEDDSSRSPLGVHGACRVLEAALQRHVAAPRVAESVLLAIARLAGGSSENCAAFATSAQVSVLIVEAWRVHKEDKAVVEACCRAVLALLSSNKMDASTGMKHFREANVADALVDALVVHASDAAVCAIACQAAGVIAQQDQVVLSRLCALGLTSIAARLFRTFVSLPSIRHVSNTLTLLCASAEQVEKLLDCDVGGSFSQALMIHKSSEPELKSICILIATVVDKAAKSFAVSLVNQYIIMDSLNFIIDKHQGSTALLLVVSDVLKALSGKEVSLELTSPALVSQVVTSVAEHQDDKMLVVQYLNVLAGIMCGKHFLGLPVNSEVCALLSSLVDKYRQDEQAIQAIARATEAFARIDPSNADKCAHSQLFANTLRLLKAHMNSEATTTALLRALLAMNTSARNIQHFVNIDVLELLHYLFSKHIEAGLLCAAACELISQVTQGSAEVERVCTAAGFSVLVVRALQLHVHDVAATTACCRALLLLCAHQPTSMQKAVDQGVADILAHALSFHAAEGSAFTAVCGVVTLFVESSEEFVAAMVSRDIRAVLVPGLAFFAPRDLGATNSCVRLLRRMYEMSPGLAGGEQSNECSNVVSVMRAGSSSSSSRDSGNAMLSDCCAVVYYLASSSGAPDQNEGSAKELGALGACQLVTGCLATSCVSQDYALASLALFTAISLVDNDRSGQNHAIFEGETKVCTHVSFVMKNMMIECESAGDLAAAALNAIAVLSRGTTNVGVFLKENICEALINHLQRNIADPMSVYYSCEIMFNFTQDTASARQRFIACKAMSHLAKILQSFAGNIDILSCAMGVLMHLSAPPSPDSSGSDPHTAALLEEFCSYGVLDVLITAYDEVSSDADVVVCVVQTILHLASHDCMLARLGRAGACRVLSSALAAHPGRSSVVRVVLSAMSAMMQDSPANQEAIFSDGIEARLLSIATKHIERKKEAVDVQLVEMVLSMLSLQCEQAGAAPGLLEAGVLHLITLVMESDVLMQDLMIFVTSCTLLTKVLDEVKELDSAKLCEMIASKLGVHRSDAEALDVSCRVLSRLKLFIKEGGSVDEGVFKDASLHVLARLEQDPVASRDSALQCCHAVHALVNLQQTLLERVDIYAKLVAILSAFPADVELLIETTRTVRSLARAGADDPVACRNSGLATALAKTLEGSCRSKPVLGRELCDCMALLLSSSDVDMLALFSHQELCASLSHFLSSFFKDKACAAAACRLGMLLCKQFSNRKALGASGVCVTLLMAVQEQVADERFTLLALDFSFSLTYECRENIEDLASSPYCTYLVEVMGTQKYTHNVAMMQSALRLACVLASSRVVRASLGKAGLCRAVVLLCQQHRDVEVITTSAMHAVRTLASNCVENKIRLGEAGCCELLVGLLQERLSSPVQCELVCAAVASLLSSKNPDNHNVAKFEQARLVTSLADVFQSCAVDTEVAKHLLVIVKHLALDSAGLAFTLRDHDILGKCVLLGQRYFASPLSLSVCECIRALAEDKDSKYALGSSGACKVVTSVVRHAVDRVDPDLLAEALLTVAALVRGSCFNQGLFGSAGICKMLASLVEEGSGSGVALEEKALWCISLLARSDVSSNTSNEGNIAIFSECGVMDSLLIILREHEGQQQLVRASSWAVRNLCLSPANVRVFLDGNGFSLLLRALQYYFHDEGTCEAICYALPPLLGTEDSAGRGLEEHHMDTCELLVPVLSSHINTETIVNRICSSLSIICVRSPRARQFLGARGACSLLTRALKLHTRVGGAEVLEELCGAMWNLCMDNVDNRVRLGSEGACELVLDALRCHAGNKYVVEAAAGCLQALSEDNPENTLRLNTYKQKLAAAAAAASVGQPSSGSGSGSGAASASPRQPQGRAGASQATTARPPPLANSE